MPAALARALAVVAVQGGASSASRAGWASRARRAVALIVDASMLFVGRSASWSLQAEAGVVPSCHLAECPAGSPPPPQAALFSSNSCCIASGAVGACLLALSW